LQVNQFAIKGLHITNSRKVVFDQTLNMNQQQRLVVIGGGAAGFFCAVNAARLNPGLKVIILEKSGKLLSKVKVSGGGRCNVTHACFDIAQLAANYPRGQNFLKKSFHWFNTKHTVEWFGERGVQLKTEDDGRMFPVTDSSQTIIDCLLREANKYHVEILLHCEVRNIELSSMGFSLQTSKEGYMQCNKLCIACGGYAKPVQFEWLKETGHTIEQPVPSLFTFNMPGNNITKLMGVSVENVLIKVAGTKLQQSGPLLITHWGFSGPAVLKLSAWAARELAEYLYRVTIVINWLPAYNEQTLKTELHRIRSINAGQKIGGKNNLRLPNRLWQYFLEQCKIDTNLQWANLPAKQQQQLVQMLTGQIFEVSGKTTFKEEFVTCGGIKLNEIDANTMQSKLVPGLFFAGEIMDIDGITGGFNFQHAWTSGYIAAKAIAQATQPGG
jgi:predicted Rossmann fold flavoprotein